CNLRHALLARDLGASRCPRMSSKRGARRRQVMKNHLTVVGFGGSLSKQSSSLAALKIALEGAAEAGAETELLDDARLRCLCSIPVSAILLILRSNSATRCITQMV